MGHGMEKEELGLALAKIKKGCLLAEKYCPHHPTTSYFILNRDIFSAIRSTSMLEAYSYFYKQGNFEKTEVSYLTRNPKVVDAIVLITTKKLSGVARLCRAVDDVLVLSQGEVDELEAFAQLSENQHKNLFPGEAFPPAGYSVSSYIANKRIFPDIPPNEEKMKEIYGVSSYGMLLRLPKEVIERHRSRFAPDMLAYQQGRLWKDEQKANEILILSTYSPEMDQDSALSYDDLISDCLAQGIQVYTQCFSEAQTPLPLTKKVALSLEVLLALSMEGVALCCGSGFLTKFVSETNMAAPLLSLASLETGERKECISAFFTQTTSLRKEEFQYVEKSMEQSLIQLEEGHELVSRYCPPKEQGIYLLLNRHIGDACLFLTCLRSVKLFYGEKACQETEHGRRKITQITVVTTPVLSGVAKLYPDVDDIIVVSPKEVQAIKTYAHTFCPEAPSLFGDAMIWTDPYMERAFYGTYELLHHLPVPSALRQQEPSSTRLSEDSLEESRQWLQTQQLDPKNMILLAPYAQTSSSLTQEECNPLISYGNTLGYRIFTNCSPTEPALEGTEKVVLPLDLCCGLATLGCKIVGTQSGFVDLLRWLQEPRLSPLVVLQQQLPCEVDWAKEWNLSCGVSKLEEAIYLVTKPEEKEDLGERIKQCFIAHFS